jgi:hypothetical protein
VSARCQRLGIGIALLLHIERGEIVAGLADVGMLSGSVFSRIASTLEQRLGSREALTLTVRGKVIQLGGDLRRVEAEGFFLAKR